MLLLTTGGGFFPHHPSFSMLVCVWLNNKISSVFAHYFAYYSAPLLKVHPSGPSVCVLLGASAGLPERVANSIGKEFQECFLRKENIL